MLNIKRSLADRLQRCRLPALFYLISLCLHLSRLFQDASLLCGKHKRRGEIIKLLVVGDEESVLYAASLFFQSRPHRVRLGKTFLYGIDLRFSGLFGRIDLVFARTAPVWSSYWERRGYFLLPKWVNFTCDTGNSGDDFLKTRPKLKRDIDSALKKGFSCEVTKDKETVSFFHKNIYAPHISGRFRELARTQSHESARYFSDKGGLLMIKQNGEYAAGAIFARRGDKLLFIMAAPAAQPEKRPGSPGLAMTAAYYFTLRLAKENGCRQVDFGGCLPFFNDGVFHYKRKWGMEIGRQALAPQEHAFKTLRLNKTTRGLLAGSPFVFRDGKNLRGMAFMDSPQPATAQEVLTCYKKYWTDGLKTLRIASFSGFCETAAKELAEVRNLELVRAGSPEAPAGHGRES